MTERAETNSVTCSSILDGLEGKGRDRLGEMEARWTSRASFLPSSGAWRVYLGCSLKSVTANGTISTLRTKIHVSRVTHRHLGRAMSEVRIEAVVAGLLITDRPWTDTVAPPTGAPVKASVMRPPRLGCGGVPRASHSDNDVAPSSPTSFQRACRAAQRAGGGGHGTGHLAASIDGGQRKRDTRPVVVTGGPVLARRQLAVAFGAARREGSHGGFSLPGFDQLAL